MDPYEALLLKVDTLVWAARHPEADTKLVAQNILSLVADALGEPKAWRLRIGDSDVWSYCSDEWQADFYGKRSGLRYVKEPLFPASPLHPQGDSQQPKDDV